MKITLLITTLSLTASSAFAATSFVEDFSSNTIGVLVPTGAIAGAPAPTFTTGIAVFPGGGNGGRAYIGTADTDFASVSFTASVDLTITAGGGANAFIGLGPGIAGDGAGGAPSFGEPGVGPTLYGAFNESGRDNGEVNFGDFNSGTTGGVTATGPTTGVVGNGTHTITLDWDAVTQMLTYSRLTIGVDAAPVIIGVQDGSDNGFTTSDARIFFGGEDGTTFDNFSVTVAAVPEPTSTLLVSIFGMLGLVRRRR